jgi:hypothetical protein
MKSPQWFVWRQGWRQLNLSNSPPLLQTTPGANGAKAFT